jgi:predicted nucleic acid-binding protein
VRAFLLDTNVVSEMTKPEPDSRVTTWLRSVSSQDTYLSVITVGEIAEGLERMRASARRRRLSVWFDELLAEYATRVLAIDTAVARAWGVLRAAARSRGKPMPIADTYLAATATVHGLVLVSRNTRDLAPTGVAILDPFVWQR